VKFEMKLEVIVIFFGFLVIAQAIPMPFRKEVPADETVAFAPYRDDVDGKDYRLPNNTKPIRYDVSLKTDVNRGETAFTGTVRIRIEAVENSNTITLHSRQLTIDTIEVFANPDTTPILVPSTSNYVDDVEFLVITASSQMVANQQYLVVITYHGLLRDDNMGFYRSSYKDQDGKTVWLATTQFEQTDARHAFPCYDEPQIRTPFGIEIKHDVSYRAISNMPTTSRTPEVGTSYVTTKFMDTLPVQTYLVAFVVSDFTSIGNDAVKPQRVFAKSQSINNNEAVLALDAGEMILNKLEEHLGVPYNLPKMDQIAVPDFDAGGKKVQIEFKAFNNFSNFDFQLWKIG
jgi:aminopeptidase N